MATYPPWVTRLVVRVAPPVATPTPAFVVEWQLLAESHHHCAALAESPVVISRCSIANESMMKYCRRGGASGDSPSIVDELLKQGKSLHHPPAQRAAIDQLVNK